LAEGVDLLSEVPAQEIDSAPFRERRRPQLMATTHKVFFNRTCQPENGDARLCALAHIVCIIIGID
jgi:hypothetical protein